MKEEPQVKTECLISNMNDPTYKIFHRTQIKEEHFQNEWNAYVKEEDSTQKPAVAPNLQCDTTYDGSIKQELLHEELDLKTENLNNHEDQMIHDPIDNKTSPDSSTSLKSESTYKQAGGLPSKCNVHHSTFIQKNDLHPQKLKQFKCNTCSYASRGKHGLKQHIKTHTGEKPFKCDLCTYASVEKGNLTKHMKTHTKERSFHCNVCSYASLRKDHLKNHMKIHSGERSFHCSVCSYASVQKHHVKKHMKIHTGEKSFQCSLCSYAGVLKDRLKTHMKIHIGEKPFKCAVCNYASVRNGDLKKHMKIHSEEKSFKSVSRNCTERSFV